MAKTPQQQIEEKIKEEFDKFYNSEYKGSVEIPDNLSLIYKKSIMALAPQFHKTLFTKVKMLASKKNEELTNGDLSDIVKVIVNTPLEKVYPSFDDATRSMIKVEKFILCYNEFVSKFHEGLQARKANLLSLSNGGSLKIIKHNNNN